MRVADVLTTLVCCYECIDWYATVLFKRSDKAALSALRAEWERSRPPQCILGEEERSPEYIWHIYLAVKLQLWY